MHVRVHVSLTLVRRYSTRASEVKHVPLRTVRFCVYMCVVNWFQLWRERSSVRLCVQYRGPGMGRWGQQRMCCIMLELAEMDWVISPGGEYHSHLFGGVILIGFILAITWRKCVCTVCAWYVSICNVRGSRGRGGRGGGGGRGRGRGRGRGGGTYRGRREQRKRVREGES